MSQSISWGYINADGTIKDGSGDFTVTRVDNGVYQVSFSREFIATPAVVGSQTGYGSLGQANTDGVAFPFVEQISFTAKTGDSKGSAQNRSFSFIAIGNR